MEERLSQLRERLATAEERLTDLRKDVDDLTQQLHGGQNVTYEHSVRGRLHTLEGTVGGFVLRRKVGLDTMKGWQAALLLVCAVATAAAAWYAALHH